MSRIKLTGGFTPMAEGIQILKITEATYDESFGVIKLTMENSKGQRHFEKFSLIGNDGSVNEKAAGAFSSLARAAMGNSDLEDVDIEELIGKFVKVEISYRTYEDKDGNQKKATQKAPGTWWETPSEEEIADFSGDKTAAPAMDVKSMLARFAKA